MKLAPPNRNDVSSATITHTLILMLAFFGVFVLATEAAQPSWWSSRDAVDDVHYTTNDYAVVVQGQLKQFTARAVDELNAKLTNYGGAGPALTNLVYGWQQQYSTNGYSSTNILPSDYTAISAGQLKYVGNKIWTQLLVAGYTPAIPYWIDVNPTDPQLANIGQVKQVFDFDLTSFASEPHINSSTTASGTVGTAFSYMITASNSPTSFGVSGLPPGLTFNISSGAISGTPTVAGIYSLMLSASNSSGTTYGTVTLTITPALPVITSATTASGTVGSVFDYTITANNNPTSFNATGLPSTNFSVNTNTGVIVGTPLAPSTNTVTLSASNAGGTVTTNLTLTVHNPSAPVITSGAPPNGSVSNVFTYTILASNNPTNFAATSLPAGLSVNEASGVISGIPTTAGSTSVTLSASNAGGAGWATNTFVINGAGVPVITSPLTANAIHGTPFSYTITGSNGPTSFSASGLPAGLTNTAGVISGNPTATTNFTATPTISASNGSGTGSAILTLYVNPPVPIISSSTSATGTVGTLFSYNIAASNNPTSFSAMGLPPGLTLNTATGVISGIPVTTGTTSGTGTYTVALGATNGGGSSAAVNLTLTINFPVPAPVITSGTMVTGSATNAFSYTITAVNNPTSYSASGYPGWASFNTSTGVLSGTPSTTGTNTVTLGASNAGGTGQATLTLIINPSTAPLISSATTATATVGSTFSYSITANNSPTSYSASGLPPGLSINTSSGAITGIPTTVGTYNVILNATNSIGTGTTTLTLSTNPPVPVITSATTASGTFGVALSPYTIVASNTPTSFSATGLPPGLNFDQVGGTISGTPTEAGTFTTTIGATNAGGTGTTTLTFTISSWNALPIVNRSIADAYNNTYILNSLGTVLACGSGCNGEIGNGAYSYVMSYTPVSNLSGIVAIAGYGDGGIALMNNGGGTGTVWTWGLNNLCQLGGGITSSTSDIPVEVVVNSTGNALSGIFAIAGGDTFNMALRSDNTVWAWGYNADGELGDDIDLLNKNGAVEVMTSTSALSGIIGMSCGQTTGVAVDSYGCVWTWGANDVGQLGYTTTSSRNYASQIPSTSLSGIVSVASGVNFNYALKSDGTVWAWGANVNGYLGNGTTTNSTTPVQVSNLSGITAIAAMGDHGVALKNDGTVWSWGANNEGQLGNGSTNNSDIPVKASDLSSVIAIASGYSFTTALKSDGSVWEWGLCPDGQTSSVPVLTTYLGTTPSPVITPAGGTYSSSQTVSISTTLTGDMIHYTLDGTQPTSSSPTYSTSFSLTASALVNAGVFNSSGTLVSPIANTQYYINDFSETGLPTTATNLVTTNISPNTIDLSWILTGQTNYNTIDVYRSSGTNSYQLITTLTPSSTNYIDSNIVAGNVYHYYVGTLDSSGQSDSTTNSITNASPTAISIIVTTPSGATNLP